MPDFTTHYLLGQRVVADLPSNIQHIIKMNNDSYNFGCQGPDLLFYSNVLTGKSPLPKLSNLMHQEKNTELLYSMSGYIAARKGKNDFHLLLSYFLGFLCHFYTDKTCHPYVYYHEARLGNGIEPQHWSGIHCKIECDIDTVLYPYYMNGDITEFQPERHYRNSDVMQRSVSAMYVYIFDNVYNIKVSQKHVYACFKDMIKLTKLFYDKTGIAKGVAGLADLIAKSKTGAFGSHFKGDKPLWHVLNLCRSNWYSLWQPDIIRSESFPQLLDIAQQGVVCAIPKYYDMITSNAIEKIIYTQCFSEGATTRDIQPN